MQQNIYFLDHKQTRLSLESKNLLNPLTAFRSILKHLEAYLTLLNLLKPSWTFFESARIFHLELILVGDPQLNIRLCPRGGKTLVAW